jgi:amidase
VAIGERYSLSDHWQAWNDLRAASFEMARFLSERDLLLTPVLGEPPLRTGELGTIKSTEDLIDRAMGYVGFTPICNTAGLPAMSVPLHWSGQGLPIGVQFVAPFGDEATLFRLAGQLERARPWGARRPPALDSSRLV